MLSSTANISGQQSPFSVLQGVDHSDKSAVAKAASEFESVFVKNMLEHMFTGLQEGGTWGTGEGSEAWRGLLIGEYANTIVDAGGIGLAQSVERELIELQEGAQ